MTVRQLKRILARLPENLEIVISGDAEGDNLRRVEAVEKKRLIVDDWDVIESRSRDSRTCVILLPTD